MGSGPPLIGGSPRPRPDRPRGGHGIGPGVGAESPSVGPSVEVPVGTTKAPEGAAEVPPSPQGRGNENSPI
jgi:hypothetical protein